MIYDSLKIVLQKGEYNQRKGSNLFINDKPIDSTGMYAWNPIVFGEEILFKTSGKELNEKKIVAYNTSNKSFKDYGYSFYEYDRNKYLIDISYNYLYSKENIEYLKLYSYNRVSKKEELFADFSSFVQKVSYPDIGEFYEADIDQVFFIRNDFAIVKLGVNQTAEGFGGFRYFIIKKDHIEEITERVIKFKGDVFDITESRLSFVSSDAKYIRIIKTTNYSDEKVSHIVDLNYNIISSVLNLGDVRGFGYKEPINGINMQKGEIVNYFLNSNTNENNEVIVPFKFIPELDIAMYKAFNDTALNQDEIKDFGKYELGILRNLIFAKHNYDFSSEFYQAYFNLFAFYNNPEMRNTRTKNVNSLLTDSDKKNLELIRDLEGKLK